MAKLQNKKQKPVRSRPVRPDRTAKTAKPKDKKAKKEKPKKEKKVKGAKYGSKKSDIPEGTFIIIFIHGLIYSLFTIENV